MGKWYPGKPNRLAESTIPLIIGETTITNVFQRAFLDRDFVTPFYQNLHEEFQIE
jgi:hypothetical protein